MHQLSKVKGSGGVALLGAVLVIVNPLALGLYGGTAFIAYAMGLAGLLVAAKAIWWPASFDYLFLVGLGALLIIAAFATGGATLWVQAAGGAAIFGSGLWRRLMSEPAGNAHTSPS